MWSCPLKCLLNITTIKPWPLVEPLTEQAWHISFPHMSSVLDSPVTTWSEVLAWLNYSHILPIFGMLVMSSRPILAIFNLVYLRFSSVLYSCAARWHDKCLFHMLRCPWFHHLNPSFLWSDNSCTLTYVTNWLREVIPMTLRKRKWRKSSCPGGQKSILPKYCPGNVSV